MFKQFFVMLSLLMTFNLGILFSPTVYAEVNFIDRPEVQDFIKQMVKKHHFKQLELISLFRSVKVRPKVMQSIKTPLERKPWYSYQMLFVTESRIREGVKFWSKHKKALEQAEQIYGVPASIIVATIGIETKYGKNTGEYPVLDALVNIAFGNTSRANYFRHELEDFLLLTREQHLNPLKVMGSYAGAIGQPQFMPSSYRNYAVNFSGSGKIDLSHDEIDVIGSIANYYQKHGWLSHQPIASPVSLKGGKYQMNLLGGRSISKSELIEAGLVPPNLKNQKFKVLTLEGYYGNQYWLEFHNFDVIKRYNPSDLYAMAVYQLSYYISALMEKSTDAWT